MTTRITSENITDATITATDLAAGAGSTDWQAVITADGSTVTTMVSGRGYFVDTSSAAGILKFPLSASRGDYVEIKDYARTFGTNNVTVQRNGHNVDGTADDATLDSDAETVKFVYIDSTKGWSALNSQSVARYGANFITASGGTETTSGIYKIHTFTGDGNFVVSALGNQPATSNKVSYVVVAGGGGGGSGGGPTGSSGVAGAGGGGGGFREAKVPGDPYTDSPLDAGTGLTISTGTYPITVGGGGSAGTRPSPIGGTGSNSVFSTITSAGGGRGGGRGGPDACADGGTGGSGGGSTFPNPTSSGDNGVGNTPPVSPPQGTNGGAGTPNSNNPSGGGGGGATAVGANAGDGPHPSNAAAGGAGGTGATTSISGSPTGYAGGGGGGGGGDIPADPDGGAGGTATQGGGAGTRTGDPALPAGVAGTANTGGGGGGGGSNPGRLGGAGGKGVVIIRYQYTAS